MAHSKRYLTLFLALLASASALCAQAPTKEVTLKFTVFALGGAEGLVYQSKAEAAPRELKFYSAYRSSQYTYRGGEQVRFFDAKATGPEAKPVAVYTIPAGAKELLLLFFSKETPSAGGIKYDVYGVNDSMDRTPAGHFTTINVSGREYVGQYGGNRITIPQGVGAVHEGNGRVSLKLAAQIGETWMPTGKHEFSMSAKDRITLIFYPSASRTGVYPIIRRLTDTLPLAPSETESVLAQYP